MQGLSRQLVKYIMIGIISIAGLSSCNTTKFLEEDEALLRGNNIKLYSKGKIDQKRALKYQLSLLYKQTPNSRFLLIPREWFYFDTQEPGDTSKFDRWRRRVLAEEPAIYDTELTTATEDAMSYYLQYEGYFNEDVYSTRHNRKKKIFITYHVTPGPQFTVDTVAYFCKDTAIHRILQDISVESFLKPGNGVQGDLYKRERDRVTKYLRNHGYAYFYNNYVAPIEADTTVGGKQAALFFEVLSPYGDSAHQAYRVGEVNVFMDYLPGQEECCMLDTTINSITINTPREDFRIDPGTIYDAIYLQQDSLFSQSDYDKTNQQLSSLGVFRFVRIKQFIDTTREGRLNFRIELTQHKKMEMGFDVEFNFASRNASGAGNLIGLTVSPNFRHRNLFKGAELLITDLSAGVEFSPSPTDIAEGDFWNTVDLRLETSLYLPRFADYMGLWRTLAGKKGREQEGSLYREIAENAATRISASTTICLYAIFTNTIFLQQHMVLIFSVPATGALFLTTLA